ncbi:MAG: VOC family protein, partial [Stackebrandtia sp.]
LLLAGSETALASHREAHATIVVDELSTITQLLDTHGATVTAGPVETPHGSQLTARHPGGAVVEYVQWHEELRQQALTSAGDPAPAAPVTGVFARLYASAVDTSLPVLRDLLGTEPALRFNYLDLELAGIGDFLLVTGTPQALAPVTSTHVTHLVGDLDAALRRVSEHGGECVSGPNQVPTGRNATVTLPGGPRIEFVEPSALEAA